MENPNQLTPEQQELLDSYKDKKRRTALIVPRKLEMNEGDTFIGVFIEKRERKGQMGKFSVYVFKDAVFKDFVSITGSALEQTDFIKGGEYEITFNGLSRTKAGHPFKSFTVYELQ